MNTCLPTTTFNYSKARFHEANLFAGAKKFSNVIGWRKIELFHSPITLLNTCVRANKFAQWKTGLRQKQGAIYIHLSILERRSHSYCNVIYIIFIWQSRIFIAGILNFALKKQKIDECFDYFLTSIRYIIVLEKQSSTAKQDRVTANSHQLSITFIRPSKRSKSIDI